MSDGKRDLVAEWEAMRARGHAPCVQGAEYGFPVDDEVAAACLTMGQLEALSSKNWVVSVYPSGHCRIWQEAGITPKCYDSRFAAYLAAFPLPEPARPADAGSELAEAVELLRPHIDGPSDPWYGRRTEWVNRRNALVARFDAARAGKGEG